MIITIMIIMIKGMDHVSLITINVTISVGLDAIDGHRILIGSDQRFAVGFQRDF